jgi:hypothetical protein
LEKQEYVLTSDEFEEFTEIIAQREEPSQDQAEETENFGMTMM